MKKYLLAGAMAIGVTFTSSMAFAECNLANLPMGKISAEVISAYTLPDMDVNPNGTFDIPARGRDICTDLPAESRSTFVFRKDKLVQLILESKDTNGLMYELALKHLGEEAKGTSKKKRHTLTIQGRSFQGIWRAKGYSVGYISYKEGDDTIESLAFTSRKYQKLMAEQSVSSEDEAAKTETAEEKQQDREKEKKHKKNKQNRTTTDQTTTTGQGEVR